MNSKSVDVAEKMRRKAKWFGLKGMGKTHDDFMEAADAIEQLRRESEYRLIACERLERERNDETLRRQRAEERVAGLRAALGRLCEAKRPLDWSPTAEIAEAFSHARAVLLQERET
jgi:predicted dienelactone hydrolase